MFSVLSSAGKSEDPPEPPKRKCDLKLNRMNAHCFARKGRDGIRNRIKIRVHFVKSYDEYRIKNGSFLSPAMSVEEK